MQGVLYSYHLLYILFYSILSYEILDWGNVHQQISLFQKAAIHTVISAKHSETFRRFFSGTRYYDTLFLNLHVHMI